MRKIKRSTPKYAYKCRSEEQALQTLSYIEESVDRLYEMIDTMVFLRNKEGLSLTEVSERTNIEVSYLKLLEDGKTVPPITIFNHILSVYGKELKIAEKSKYKLM